MSLVSRRKENKTMSSPKVQPFFVEYINASAELSKAFAGMKHVNYTNYEWSWLEKRVAAPDINERAVCVDVAFAVSKATTHAQPSGF